MIGKIVLTMLVAATKINGQIIIQRTTISLKESPNSPFEVKTCLNYGKSTVNTPADLKKFFFFFFGAFFRASPEGRTGVSSYTGAFRRHHRNPLARLAPEPYSCLVHDGSVLLAGCYVTVVVQAVEGGALLRCVA